MAVIWNHWKPKSNTENPCAARYTLIRRNGKPVHANKREIIKLAQSEGVSQVLDRVTGETVPLNLETGQFARKVPT